RHDAPSQPHQRHNDGPIAPALSQRWADSTSVVTTMAFIITWSGMICVVCQNGPVRPFDHRPDSQNPDGESRESRSQRLQWLEEGPHQVLPGVHRIPLPLPMDGLRAVNAYAIEASDGLVMIDSGWLLDETKATLERSLARLGAGLGDIRGFLITHIHRDHYTQ